jgi:U3 small nucleolar RNA-associated protein 14
MSGPVDVKLPSKSPLADLDNSTASNPWLQADTSKLAKQSRKANKAQGKTDDKAELLISKLKKNQKSKQAEAEEDVEIDLDNVLTIAQAKEKTVQAKQKNMPVKPAATAPAAKTSSQDQDDTFASDDESGDEADDGGMTHAKNPLAFTQRELVEQAFANDNVVQEFEEEKREAMEEDAPKDQDLTLPGWGAWGGKGLKDRKNVVVKKALPGEGVTASKRKDAKLGNVIISEKRIKKVRLVNQQLLELYEL